MKRTTTKLAALIAATFVVGPTMARAEVKSMDAYLWQNRPVLVFAPTDDHPLLTAQRAALADDAAGLAEREMVVIAVAGDRVTVDGQPAPGLSANDLRRRYGIGPGDAAALLVGKDGGVKMREDRALTPEMLFPTIDAMPMRRREMRDRGADGS